MTIQSPDGNKGADGPSHRLDDTRKDSTGDPAAPSGSCPSDRAADGGSPLRASIPIAWQPFETAPKDGTKIVLAAWCDYNECWRFRVSWWRKYLSPYGAGFNLDFHPTHWMPLPAQTIEAGTAETAQRAPVEDRERDGEAEAPKGFAP